MGATRDTNYGKLVLSGGLVFGGLYLAATFGAGWAWGLAVLVSLSVLITADDGDVFVGIHKTIAAINKGFSG